MTVEKIRSKVIDEKNEIFRVYFGWRIRVLQKFVVRSCVRSWLAWRYERCKRKITRYIQVITPTYGYPTTVHTCGAVSVIRPYTPASGLRPKTRMTAAPVWYTYDRVNGYGPISPGQIRFRMIHFISYLLSPIVNFDVPIMLFEYLPCRGCVLFKFTRSSRFHLDEFYTHALF